MWLGFPVFPEQASTLAPRVDVLYFFLIAVSAFLRSAYSSSTASGVGGVNCPWPIDQRLRCASRTALTSPSSIALKLSR